MNPPVEVDRIGQASSMGRKRRERTKPEEEGEARNGDSNPSPVPRTTRSPAQDLGAAVAAATVEERRGRQIWGRSSLVRQEADLGEEAPPSGLARAATAVFRGKGGEEL